ncbi:MAG: hypothetical protein AAF944_26580 [Bacteroidota bacterium]
MKVMLKVRRQLSPSTASDDNEDETDDFVGLKICPGADPGGEPHRLC